MYRLLVVDDEPFIRKGIVTLISFSELGIGEVMEASNGLDALEKVRSFEPQILLCDINMPKLNGLEFAKIVKEEKPWIKIGMITGYDYFEYAKQALKIGVEDYILKPVSKQDVYEVLVKLIKKVQQEEMMKEVYQTIHKENEQSVEIDGTGYKKKIQEIIDEQFDKEEFSLSFLASKLGLTNSYLSSLFKKIYGIPFQDYVLNERLEKGKLLLLSTSLKNYEIAEKIGIRDPNYFSTLFHKKFGESPNQYKRKVMEKND
jgi:two-component system response regulator YesN